jgi:LPXTG-motif cell wall-anchored protein
MVLHSVGFTYPTTFFLGNLVGNDYYVNLTTSNANHALIYIDGSLRDTIVGNTTFITTYFDLSEAPHVLKIEVYDVLNRLTNSTDHAFRVYFEPYINIYSNLNNQDYFINMSTNHTKEVLIYIDLTLVDTVPGNSTFVKTYLNLAETTHTVKFEIYDVLGILFNSTTRTFNVLPLNPVYVLFIDVIDDNTNLQIDYWASNTDETEIYIDGDLEYTVADETPFFIVVKDLSKGIHYIDIDIHDVDHDLFKSISTTIHIYAPASSGGGGGYEPPSGYPDAPYPPPTNEGSTIDYGPFASLTGQQSLWVVVIAGVGLATAFLFFRRKKVNPKKNRSRKRR